MKILFDQGTPVPLPRFLPEHEVETAFERGWSDLKSGDLPRAAEAEGFACFVATDQTLGYQQQLAGRTLAIVVLLSTSWPKIEKNVTAGIAAIEAISPGNYVEVTISGETA